MFQQAILHPQYGLKIIIFTNPVSRNRYILLRPSEIDLELFLSELNGGMFEHSQALED